jgi:hypothetical protein
MAESGFPHPMRFVLLILFRTNTPTWKSALRPSGAPVSKPARTQGQWKFLSKMHESPIYHCKEDAFTHHSVLAAFSLRLCAFAFESCPSCLSCRFFQICSGSFVMGDF